MLPVTKTTLPSLEDYVAYLEQIWQAGQLTNNGPLCRQLADDIASYLGVSNLELVANGTLALQPVGRNKLVRATARIGVSGISQVAADSAGNATTRYAWVVLFRPTPVYPDLSE